MAATLHQLPNVGVVTESRKKRKRSPTKDFFYKELDTPHFKHTVTGDPLWMDGWVNPSWVHGELTIPAFIAEPSHDTLSSAHINSYVTSLRVCTRHKDLLRGTRIHHDLVQKRLVEMCSDALVTMYAKCGELGKATALLDVHNSKDVITWTSMIAGYTREGQGHSALACFEQMQCEGILPNAVTYLCALKACAMIRAYDRGRKIHDEIARQGLLSNDIVLGNVLVDMYAKCGALSEARRVLRGLPSRDVVSWSALIAGYALEGEAGQALDCLKQMRHEGILPNAVTYVSALQACANIRAVDRGKQIHDEIVEQGLLQNDIVLGNALVDMYAKCGDLSEARRVLEELPSRDIFSWNALIAGYAQEGQGEQALNSLKVMEHEGIIPDAVTYGCALKACATIRDIDRGQQIHNEITRHGFLQNDIVLCNALVDMYAKCGDLFEAQRVLEGLPSRDVVSWSSLIAGFAQKGEVEQALNCLQQMQSEGILPDAVTCTSVLKMCCHQGLVEEGQSLFVSMSSKFGVKPTLECYTSMIGLLGRAGHLGKAVRLVQEMPSSGYMAIWHALLGASGMWADVNVGGWAFKQAIKLDESDDSVYILMANIYAAAGMEEEAKKIETMRIRNRSLK